MPYRTEEINPQVLKACREQMGFDLSEVKKKVGRITEFEAGSATPTLKQLEKLASLYKVPRWVFVSDRLPENTG
ncbi:MAG: helix-turn-helix transcriptional regulator [Candidatus Marinimicrobia bacterium]|nr:helix-turn-helix transcriptional regulator [Candidatus Neomarinimicrobiota bacterium]